jgi:iron complex outermembrane recepter protein
MKLNKILSAIFAFSCAAASHHAAAQLEEVIVTAQKRAESLQDVSVSVSVISGEKLANVAITRIEDMSAYIPNLTLSETAIGTQLFVRGIGSGINQGFEQSVGTYVDGVYYGRAQLTRSPFFDMERIEVLRGPQVTLFGNNSIGGALSLNTSKPTNEVEASISVLYEPENNEREYIIIGNTPLNDWASARFAYRKYDFGGYVENVFTGDDGPDRNFDTARLTFMIEPTDSLTATLKLEHSTFDTNGRQISIFGGLANTYGIGSSSTGNTYAGSNPTVPDNEMTLADVYNSSAFSMPGDPDFLQFSPDGDERYSNGEHSQNTTNNVTLAATWSLDSGYELSGTMSYLEYQYDELCDCDFSALELINYYTAEDFEQKSFEFRFSSPGNQTFDVMGGFYVHEDTLAYDDNLVMGPEGNPISTLANAVVSGIGLFVKDMNVPRTFDQDTSQQAAFGQLTWNMTDNIRLIAGARRSHYKKSAKRELQYTDKYGTPYEFDDVVQADLFPGVPIELRALYVFDVVYSTLFGTYRHDEEGTREKYVNSYNLIAEWDLSESVMLYVSKSYGFKAGGYDVRSNSATSEETQSFGGLDNGIKMPLNSIGTFEFEDEKILSHELGIKTRITENIELNAAYFYSEISDMQVSTFDGSVSFNVSNAGKARTQGLELELRAALSENLLFTASFATLDFKFLDYPNGPCITSDELLHANGREDEMQRNCRRLFDRDQKGFYSDLEGETNIYVADYSGLFSLHYKRDIFDSLMFNSSIDYAFTDEFFTNESLDPNMKQNGYGKFNVRLALSDIDNTWTAALLVRNLTDKSTLGFSNNVPLAASQFGAPTYYGFVEPGRSVALQLQYQY